MSQLRVAKPARGLPANSARARWSADSARACVASQVIDEVSGRHAMKSGHPVLQPAVIGVDILDMPSALSNPLPGVRMDNAMRDATGTSEGGVDAGAIRA